ncbi:MAG: hypothetical protein ABIB12_02140 [Patescibacteria group bacterium]
MKSLNESYLKYKVCVSGAAETSHCGPDAFQKAEELGKEIVRHGAVLVQGATTGFPYWAAKGAKQEGGIVIGISPAATEKEHVQKYKLPTDYIDIIIYTGEGYAGRNLLLTRASDAVVVGCGRMGTVNEFTVAFEDKKPLGVLEGNWETDEILKKIVKESHRQKEMEGKLIFEKDPKILLDKLMVLISKEKEAAKL